uniref:Uncharacterized protein AlNc14C28G2678 n=1 Tax=Albugo laibachii Nc14 TaxID=890382 RepID=F0W749_9STRA|nr:conserved hypothetical protein [Albugo laibachii Nc14]|eukprot:CCA16948.1 conserved hypothetical protein [Albugo laibachii Nc14]
MDEASKGKLAWRHQMRYLVFVTPIGSISESDFYKFLGLLRRHSSLPLKNITKPSNHAVELCPFPSFSWDQADTTLDFQYHYKSIQDLHSITEGEEAHVHAWNRVIGVIGLVHYPTFMCQGDATLGRLESIENAFHQIIGKLPSSDQLIFQKCFVLEYGFDLSRENRFLGERESKEAMELIIFPMYQSLANGESTLSVHLKVVLDTLAVTIITAMERLIHAVLSDIDGDVSSLEDSKVGKRSNNLTSTSFGASFSPSAMVSAAAAAISKRSGMLPSALSQAESFSGENKSRVAGIALFRTNIEPFFMRNQDPKAPSKVKGIREQYKWRKHKLIGDYAMMLSCYSDAKSHYERAIEHLRQQERHFTLTLDALTSSDSSYPSNDQNMAQATGNALWLAAALEGHLHCMIHEHENRISVSILEQVSETLVHYARAGTPSMEIKLIQKAARYLVSGITNCRENRSDVQFWCKRLLLEVVQRGYVLFPVLPWRHQVRFLLHFEALLTQIDYHRHALMLLMDASSILLKHNTNQLDCRELYDVLVQRLRAVLVGSGKATASVWLDIRFHALRQLCALAITAKKWTCWIDFIHVLLWNLVEHDRRIPKGDMESVEDEDYGRVQLLQSCLVSGDEMKSKLSAVESWHSLPSHSTHKQSVLMDFYRNRMLCAVKSMESSSSSTKAASVSLLGVLSLFDRTSNYYQVPPSLDASAMRNEHSGTNMRKYIPFSLLSSGPSPLSAMSSAAESISSALAGTPRMLMVRTPRRQTITSLMRSPSFFDLKEERIAFDDDDLEPLKLRIFSQEETALIQEKLAFKEEKNTLQHLPIDSFAKVAIETRWNLESRRCITACQEEALHLLTESSSLSKGWNDVAGTTRCALLLVFMQPKWEEFSRYPIFLEADVKQRIRGRMDNVQGGSSGQENAFLYSPFRDSRPEKPFPSAKKIEEKGTGNELLSHAKARMERMTLQMKESREIQACAVYEAISIEYLLGNPLGIPLTISDATVWAQYTSTDISNPSNGSFESELECHPASFTILPYQEGYHCSLIVRPLLPGTIEIRGIQCDIADHKFQLSTEMVLLQVLHPIPLVSMRIESCQASDISLSDSDFADSDKHLLWLHEYETKRFELVIENIGRHRVEESQLLIQIYEVDRMEGEKLLDAVIVWDDKQSDQSIQSIRSRRMWLKVERPVSWTSLLEEEQCVSVFFEIGFALSEANSQWIKSSGRKLFVKWKLVSTATIANASTDTERYFRESNLMLALQLLPSLTLKTIRIDDANIYTPNLPTGEPTKGILSDSLYCHVIFQLWNPTESPFQLTAKALGSLEVCVDIDRQCLRQITIQLALDSFAPLLRESPSSSSWKDRFCKVLQAHIQLDWRTHFQSRGNLEFRPEMLTQSCGQLAIQLLPAHILMHLGCAPHRVHPSQTKLLEGSNVISFPFASVPHLRERLLPTSVSPFQFISLNVKLEWKPFDTLWSDLIQEEMELAVLIRQLEGAWLNNQSDGWKHFALSGKTVARVDTKNVNRSQVLELKILFLTHGTFEIFSRVRCSASQVDSERIDIYCGNPLTLHVQD